MTPLPAGLRRTAPSALFLCLAIALCFGFGSCGGGSSGGGDEDECPGAGGAIVVSSTSISACRFSNPDMYKHSKGSQCTGMNFSPNLSWPHKPGAMSYAVVMEDTSVSPTWYHWILYDIPSTGGAINLPEEKDGYATLDTSEAPNSWDEARYGGPCPPDGEHTYKIYVVALPFADAALEADFPGEANQEALAEWFGARSDAAGLGYGWIYVKVAP